MRPIEVSRWVVLVLSIYLMVSAGTGYAFGLYSQDIKTTLQFTQGQINMLALGSNLGGYLPFSGFFLDRFGPRWTVFVGCFINSTGYFLLWLTVSQRITVPFGLVMLFCAIWGNGSGWFDSAVLGVGVKNFAYNRGLVIGLLKGFYGLSASIVTEFYNALFKPDSTTFLLFLAGGLSGMALLVAPFLTISPAPPQDKYDNKGVKRKLYITCGIIVIAAVYLSLISVVTAVGVSISKTAHFVLLAGLVVLLLSFWLLVLHTGPVITALPWSPARAPRKPSALTPANGLRRLVGEGVVVVPDDDELDDIDDERDDHDHDGTDAVVDVNAHHKLKRKSDSPRLNRASASSSASSSSALGASASGASSSANAAVANYRTFAKGAGASSSSSSSSSTSSSSTSSSTSASAAVSAQPAVDDHTSSSSSFSTASYQTALPASAASSGDYHALHSPVSQASHRLSRASLSINSPPHHSTASPLSPLEETPAGAEDSESLLPQESQPLIRPTVQIPSEEEDADADPFAGVDTSGMTAEEKSLMSGGVRSEINTKQALCTLDYWLVLLVVMGGAATGLTLLNNIAQFVEALGGEAGSEDVFVSFFSVANCTGRMTAGIFSDKLRGRVPRPYFLTACLLLSCASAVYIGFSSLSMLYFGVFTSGLGYGALWVLQPSVTCELFGQTHFGAHYNLLGVGPAVIAYSVSTKLASELYDSYITNGSNTCLGPDCFRYTFFIIAGIAACSALLSVLLAYRTKEFYYSDSYVRAAGKMKYRIRARRKAEEKRRLKEAEEAAARALRN